MTPGQRARAIVVGGLLLIVGWALTYDSEVGALWAPSPISPSSPLLEPPPCEQPGWFPADFGLKDHTLFWYDGLYYLASIYLAADGYEQRFAYASSPDLCTWTDLQGILRERTPGAWDEFRIWAPFVYQEGGEYYMYYTGVTADFTQSILLATSRNPADPGSWQHREEMVFQPSHPDVVWPGSGFWSDCRDPTVVKVDGLYHLYYTGMSQEGGIVGLATAPSPMGPWVDWGPITEPTAFSIPESPTLVRYGAFYYLVYHDVGASGLGPVVRFGPTPAGPWSTPRPFPPGWAHEIWTAPGGEFWASYVWQGGIAVQPLTWDDAYDPPQPFIGWAHHRVLLPLVRR